MKQNQYLKESFFVNLIFIFGGKTVDIENPSKHKIMSLEDIFIIKLEYLDISQIVMSPVYIHLFNFEQLFFDVFNSLILKQNKKSPKRQQKEEQLHWNIMAFPALELKKEDKQNDDNKQDDLSNYLYQISQIQQSNSIREDKFSFDSEVEYYDDQVTSEQKYYSKAIKKKMQYQLSQVIEEKKEQRENEEQNEDHNQSLNNDESDDEDKKYTIKSRSSQSAQKYDPFDGFPEFETEDGKQSSQIENI